MKKKIIIIVLIVLGVAFWMISLAGGFGTGGEEEAERDRKEMVEDKDNIPGWAKSFSFLDTMPRLTPDELEAQGDCRFVDNVLEMDDPGGCTVEVTPADEEEEFRKAILVLAGGRPVRVIYEDNKAEESDEEHEPPVLRQGENVSFVAQEKGGTLRFEPAPGGGGTTRIKFKK
jgi:hypothetical protein